MRPDTVSAPPKPSETDSSINRAVNGPLSPTSHGRSNQRWPELRRRAYCTIPLHPRTYTSRVIPRTNWGRDKGYQVVGMGTLCMLDVGKQSTWSHLCLTDTLSQCSLFESYSIAATICPKALSSPYTHPHVVTILSRIDRVFEEGGTVASRGTPYAPLAWDPLFILQPEELAAGTQLLMPRLSSYQQPAQNIRLKCF